jgi:hypothetical protein
LASAILLNAWHVDNAFVQANLEISILPEGANCISEGHQGVLDASYEIRIVCICGA